MAFNRSKKINVISLSSAYPQNIMVALIFTALSLFMILQDITAHVRLLSAFYI